MSCTEGPSKESSARWLASAHDALGFDSQLCPAVSTVRAPLEEGAEQLGRHGEGLFAWAEASRKEALQGPLASYLSILILFLPLISIIHIVINYIVCDLFLPMF